jgi:hypothetical protein
MEKKGAVGIKIYGSSLLLFPIFLVLNYVNEFFMINSDYQIRERIKDFIAFESFWVVCGLAVFLLALGILRLKNWTRLILIQGSLLFLCYFIFIIVNPFHWDLRWVYYIYPFIVYFVVIAIVTLIFLTRPKVKEQFR